MTIVVALKVGDGLVLGADSASTLFTEGQYHNSYFNTEKLIHIDGFPVGAITFGLGALKNRSVSSLANDLRHRLKNGSEEWKLDSENFSVGDIVDRFKRYYYDELYVQEFGDPVNSEDEDLSNVMGFFIGGFSSQNDSSEVWRLLLTSQGCQVVKIIDAEAPWDCVWEGSREPIQRILFGFSSQMMQRLIDAGIPEETANRLLASVDPLVNGAMPIQDAVDFVDYLISVTCGYVRFAPGHVTVAKPIDIAAITKYNGFKWVARKHYYPANLNKR